jgi:RimJ/RimL family protein N-acetyltransferase
MSWGDTGVVEDQLPEHSMTDEVVMLRPLALNDAPAWLAGEDEEQRRWFEAPRPSQLSDVEQFIADCQESWRTMGNHRHWGIWSLDPDVLVGGVDLRALGNDEVNLSYLVFPGQRRRGFALRAAQLVLEYASTSMSAQTVIIKMLSGNEKSRNLALALGALYVGDEPSDGGATFHVFRLWLQDTPREE